MKKIVLMLAVLIIAVGCSESIQLNDENKHQISNVNFTPCVQNTVRNAELSSAVNVKFTSEGVQITHFNFEVHCDFTTVNVTHTFANGVLNITQQGSPNQAKCICYTDVSYTINGISQNEVNVIFINGEQVYCYNENNIPCHCIMDTLKGEWSWIKKYGGFHGNTTDNDFKSIVKILSQNDDASVNYEVFVEDTLFYKGTFQMQVDSWNKITTNIKLPHWGHPLIEDWIIYLGDMLSMIPSENTLCFRLDGITDDYIYYYRKMK